MNTSFRSHVRSISPWLFFCCAGNTNNEAVELTLQTRGEQIHQLRESLPSSQPMINFIDRKDHISYFKRRPFQIEEVIGEVAYTLRVQDDCRIHPVVHISLLKPYRGKMAYKSPLCQHKASGICPYIHR